MDFGYILLLLIAGCVGTAAMDGVKYVGAKLRLIGGVKMDLLGRWAYGMPRGQFVYADIHDAQAVDNEVRLGWIFHYIVGAVVALGYPIMLMMLNLGLDSDPIFYATVFGIATSVFPWFIVYPAFGVGFFGSRAPKAAKPVLTSLVSHTFYGLGIGLTISLLG